MTNEQLRKFILALLALLIPVAAGVGVIIDYEEQPPVIVMPATTTQPPTPTIPPTITATATSTATRTPTRTTVPVLVSFTPTWGSTPKTPTAEYESGVTSTPIPTSTPTPAVTATEPSRGTLGVGVVRPGVTGLNIRTGCGTGFPTIRTPLPWMSRTQFVAGDLVLLLVDRAVYASGFKWFPLSNLDAQGNIQNCVAGLRLNPYEVFIDIRE